MSQKPAASKSSALRSFRSAIFLLLIMLAGFALRLHDLDGQSMWSDEGLSLYRSGLPLTSVIRNVITVDGIDTRDTSPALYFLILHLWRQLSGDTVFAMRFIGAALATLSVPLMYALGQLSFGRRAALMAALLMAISPFHVWQSQILRNYGLLLSFNLLSVYGLLRFLLAAPGKRRAGWLLLWLAAGLVSIYAHYFGFFVFAFGLVALVLFAVQQVGLRRLLRQRWLWIGLGFGLLVALPAGFVALDRFGAGRQVDFFFVPVPTVAYQALSAFAAGMEPSLVHPWWRVLPALILALVGTWFGFRSRRRATLFLLGYQFIPLGLLLVLSLINPLYNGTRHLLIGLPPFLLLVAEGVAGSWPDIHTPLATRRWFKRPWRWAGPLLGLLVVIIQLSWLYAQFNSPRLIRDDVRGAARYLSHVAAPEDIVVLHDTLIGFTFDYYYDGAAPVVAVPAYYQQDFEAAKETLANAVQGKERVWFLNKPTPRNGFDRQALLEWTEVNWLPADERDFSDMWLRTSARGFLLPPEEGADRLVMTPLDMSWENGLALHGYSGPSRLNAGYQALFGFDFEPSGTDYQLLMKLVDDQGRVWAELEGDRLFAPASDAASTESGRHHYLLKVPAGPPPGNYQLVLSLLDPVTHRPLSLVDGQYEIAIGNIPLQSAVCAVDNDYLPDHTPTNRMVGKELELLGYISPTREAWAESLLSIDLFWCVHETPEESYRQRLELIDENGQVIAELVVAPASPSHPIISWQPGELLQSKVELPIPAGAEAGSHKLRFSLLPAGTGKALAVDWPLGPRTLSLGSVDILPPYLKRELPDNLEPLRADFYSRPLIALEGYELASDRVAPGDSLDLSLIWRSLRDELTESYVVIVTLVDETGQTLVETGSVPADGRGSTIGWQAGDLIDDTHRLTIPPEAPPGPYQLLVTIADPETGFRLPFSSGGTVVDGNRLALTTISIGP